MENLSEQSKLRGVVVVGEPTDGGGCDMMIVTYGGGCDDDSDCCKTW